MKRQLIVWLIALIGECLQAQHGFLEDLDSVVVYSARIPQLVQETGRDITLLSRREIQSIPASSLEELLRFLPGIETQQRGMFGVQGDISVRGSNFTQVLVLLDGMRLNDPLTGHFNNNFPVSVNEIERIEIIRGPSSSAYGPDAVGGIIHIITRSFSGSESAQRFSSGGMLQAGNYHLIRAEGTVQASNSKLLATAGGSLNKTDGYPFSDGLPGYFNLRSGSISFRWKINDFTRLSYRLSIDSRDFSAWRFYTTSLADSADESTGSLWHQLKIVNKKGKQTKTFDLSYKKGSDNYVFNSLSVPNEHVTRMANFHYSQQIDLSRQITLLSGIQCIQQSIESNDRGTHELTSGGAYFLGFWKPVHRLNVNIGGRLEHNEVYGTGFLPQAAISWQEEHISFRAATGKSFRAPDFTERFVGSALPYLAPNRNLGNPDLSAEKAWTHETGADLHFGTPFMAGFTLFTRSGTDIIDYVSTRSSDIRYNTHLVPDTNYLQAQNFSSLSTSGIEVHIASHLIAGIWNTGINLGYTFLDTRSDQKIISRYISNHSRHVFSGSMQITDQHFRGSIAFIMKERVVKKAMEDLGMKTTFFNLNLSLGYSVFQGKLLCDITVNNLTNAQNMDIPGLRLPGRWISTGIGWKI